MRDKIGFPTFSVQASLGVGLGHESVVPSPSASGSYLSNLPVGYGQAAQAGAWNFLPDAYNNPVKPGLFRRDFRRDCQSQSAGHNTGLRRGRLSTVKKILGPLQLFSNRTSPLRFGFSVQPMKCYNIRVKRVNGHSNVIPSLNFHFPRKPEPFTLRNKKTFPTTQSGLSS